jgi:GT2 family glycosyltransferase
MIHILTLSWNGESKLAKLYPSLVKSMEGLEWTWHIKDNGSVDGSINLIESWKNENVISYAYHDNNQNFSEGCNYLFSKCNAKEDDFVLLLNNDIVIKNKKSIKNMIDIFKDKDVGVVGARLTCPINNTIQHAGVVFHEHNKLPLHHAEGEKITKETENDREVQACTGACLLTKASLYKAASPDNLSGNNGLLESLQWGFDDIDFCLQIKYNMSKKVIYCGNTEITHEQSASLKIRPINKLFQNHNINVFRGKWAGVVFTDRQLYKNANHNVYKGIK